ncbi:MAG: hypothetical protein K2O14_14930 [Oscillospiraceae bacterium]|nr:hypothetical protein [Oscillospiraceae bacterium]
MTDKNGIYLSVDGDDAVRVIIENNIKIQTDRLKVSDELIGELEYDMSNYEVVLEHISEKTEPLDDIGVYSEEQFSAVSNAALELADGVRENDLTSGVLLRATVNKLLDFEDDGTAMCLMTAMSNIVDALREPLDTRYILYKYLKSRSEFDTSEEWLRKNILPKGYFFRRDYPCEIINYDLFTNESRLSQVYFFDNYTDYFVFLFLKFAEQGRRVLECPCCGKLFVPKSNRAEIYCDRVLVDGKTCKQIAPKLARKLKQRNDPLLEKYEKAKNRNYKRVERYENADENSGVMRLTFNEYKAWLDKASEMKRLYLQGKIISNEFLNVIRALD